MDAINISYHFLGRLNREDFAEYGEGISNLKMQKLLYYSQKVHYSFYNEPLFIDDIEAWKHGPVIPKVYQFYKKYSNNVIDIFELEEEIKNKKHISYDESMVLDFVLDKYGHLDAWAIRNLSHNEIDWKNNYLDGANYKISLNDMFSTELKNEFDKFNRLLDEL